MSNLYDILEICLWEVENGAELETVLMRYPDLADELRPLLTASVKARQLAVPAPSAEVLRRNRVRLLQRAAQKREWTQDSNRRFSSFQGARAVVFVLFILVLFSGLNVIHASALALPGDGLYPVKRWWEQVRLLYTYDEAQHDMLASEIENERLREIDQLFRMGLSAEVDFAGVVTSQRGETWRIANMWVSVTAQTKLPDGPVQVGEAVRVYGVTRGDAVFAERIESLLVNSALPGMEPIFEVEEPSATAQTSTAISEPETETPDVQQTETPEVDATETETPPVNVNSNTNGNDNNGSNVNSNVNDNDNQNNNDNENDNNNEDNSGSGGNDNSANDNGD